MIDLRFESVTLLGCKSSFNVRGRDIIILFVSIPCRNGVGSESFRVISPYSDCVFPILRDLVGCKFSLPRDISFMDDSSIWVNSFEYLIDK